MALLFFFLAAFATNTFATPPSMLYRVDFRSPDVIFTQGFLSRGRNDNLLDHISGRSLTVTGNPASNFIALTGNADTARRLARELFQVNPERHHGPAFIYTIRATANMYDATAYLQNAVTNALPLDREEARALARAYRYQREWVAVGRIPREQVISAIAVFYDPVARRLRHEERPVTNRLTINEDTRANDAIYPVYATYQPALSHGARIVSQVGTALVRMGHALSLDYCTGTSTSSAERRRRSVETSRDEQGGCHNIQSIPASNAFMPSAHLITEIMRHNEL
ncbi:MAG: hypothetical protein ACRYGG_04410 [Janthinobacterium lividum]